MNRKVLSMEGHISLAGEGSPRSPHVYTLVYIASHVHTIPLLIVHDMIYYSASFSVQFLAIEGLSCMDIDHEEVAHLLRSLRCRTSRAASDKDEVTAVHISACMYGIRNCTNVGQEEIKSLLIDIVEVET